MKRAVVVLSLVLAWLVVAAPPASACSCAGLTPREYAERAELVVLGTVTGVDEPWRLPLVGGPDETGYEVKAHTVYKGAVGERFAFFSESSGASCGVEGLDDGRPHLMFLDRAGDRWWGSLCGGTDMVTEKQLRGVLEPVAGQPGPAEPRSDPPDLLLTGMAAVAGCGVLAGVLALRRRRP